MGSSEGGSDYEPDEEQKTKSASKRGIRGVNKKRKRRGSDSWSDEEGGSSSGEEWGKKRKGKGRRKKKKANLSDSDEASMSSDDSEPKGKRSKKQQNSGFSKAHKLSEDLEAVVGTDKASRGEVIKLLWAYIKDNDLQDPKNKQWAICDDKLEKVIGEKKFKCFGMAKYLKEHMS